MVSSPSRWSGTGSVSLWAWTTCRAWSRVSFSAVGLKARILFCALTALTADWTDWNTLNTVTLNGTKNLGFPGDLPLAFNWQGSWFYEFGVTRHLNEKCSVSTGYFFLAAYRPPKKDFNPVVPTPICTWAASVSATRVRNGGMPSLSS